MFKKFALNKIFIEKAQEVSKLKQEIKNVLDYHNRNYDKFTVHNKDSFLGVLSEMEITDFLTEAGVKVKI